MSTQTEFHTKIVELAEGIVRLEFSMEPINRSSFPHPLITVDYDADNDVVGITAVGSKSDYVIQKWTSWRSSYAAGEERDLHWLVRAIA